MPTLLILEAVALVAILWILALLVQAPAAQFKRKVFLTIPAAVGAVALLGAMTLNFMVYTNTPGPASAAAMGGQSGLQAQAADWLAKHKDAPPARDEVGRNIRLITEGLAFLRPYRGQLAPHHDLKLDEAGQLSTQLTRVLSATEEREYFEAATAVVEAVRSLAAPPTK